MKSLKALLLFCSFALLVPLKGQDIHFSMFDMAPLSLNPAYTGAFYGTYRVGGVYRDQWASFLPGQFTTPSFYLDAPVLTVRKNDWIGVGGMVYQDQAGTGKLLTGTYQLSAAYHLALDKKADNVLTLGVQGGQLFRKFSNKGGGFGGEYYLGELIPENLGGEGNSTIQDDVTRLWEKNKNPSENFFDVQAGLLFKSRINKTTDLTLGFAALHLTRGKGYGLVGNSENARQNMRFNVHGQMNMALTNKWTLTPQFLYTRMGPASEAALQAWGTYAWDPQRDINFRTGLGYRFGDAAEVLVGVDYKDLRVGVSYDVNVSSLKDATKFRGGFEIALMYVGKIYKKPKVKPVIICPKF